MEATVAVAEVIAVSGTTSKTKRYTSFTDEDRAAIGKHAAENSNASALKKFKGTFPDFGESTVRLFKRKYLEAVKQRKAQGDSSCITSIPSKRKGRPLTLGDLNIKVQQYDRTLRQAGTPVGTAVIIASAKGIVMSVYCTLLGQNGGHIQLTKAWTQSLMHRMGLVKRKTSTQKSKMRDEKFQNLKSTFLTQVGFFAKAHSIPANLVINWDQTGIKRKKEVQDVSRLKAMDKRMITAIFATTLSGKFLPMQILYGGKTG